MATSNETTRNNEGMEGNESKGEETVSEEDIHEITNKTNLMHAHRTRLFQALGLSSAEIEIAKMNAIGKDVISQAENVLRCWISKKGNGATRREICKALHKERLNSAREYLEMEWGLATHELSDITDQDIRLIVFDTSLQDTEMQNLFRALDLKSDEIESIEKSAIDKDTKLIAISVFNEWRMKTGKYASRSHFIDVLKKCRLKKAQKVLEETWGLLARERKRKLNPQKEIEESKIEWDNIVFHGEVGRGAFGIVHRVTFKKPYKGYREAAAKTMRVLTNREMGIMHKFRHRHIVTYVGFYSHGPMNVLFFEFASNGSLLEYLLDMSKEISKVEKDKWANQSALAIQYLHRNQCLHRDIKPQNCLLFENNTLKLCDFGLATETDCSKVLSTIKGTYQYMAPEIINTNQDGKSTFSVYTDIYAYGMLLLTIYDRKIPFSGRNMPEVTYRVSRGELKPDIPSQVPTDIARVMSQCWEVQPNKRPTIDRIIQAYWIYTHYQHITLREKTLAFSLALHPNGNIVIGSWDKLVLLHKNGKETVLPVENQPNIDEKLRKIGKITFVADIRISPQGHVCVLKLLQRNIYVFSEKGEYLNQFSIPNYNNEDPYKSAYMAVGFTFDRDGRILITNANQGVITEHECPSGEIVGKFERKYESRCDWIRMAVNKKNQILYHFTPMDSVYSRVVAIDHSGNELFDFNPKIDEDVSDTWIWATGIVCDSHDNIIIAMSPYSHVLKGHIHKYSPTGDRFLGCITHGLYDPTDISILHDDSILAVANRDSVVLIPID